MDMRFDVVRVNGALLAAKLTQIVRALHSLLVPPVVILVALEASPLGKFFRRSLCAMAFLAGRDAGKENVRRLVTRRHLCVARFAGHHAMRIMAEFRTRHPSRGDVRLRNLRKRPSRSGQRVALFAGLAPEQVFRFFHPEPNPFPCVAGDPNQRWSFRNLPIEAHALAYLSGMRGNVFRKAFLKKCVHNLRFVVRNLLFREALIEVEQVARCAVLDEFWRCHIGGVVRGSHSRHVAG